MSVVVSIQARMGSTRLPGKVLLQLGGRRVIDWVVNRCKQASGPDLVVVTTGDRPENDAIREWAVRRDVHLMAGPEENLLQRHLDVAREFDADLLVRITADCPCIPPAEIDRVLDSHYDNNAVYSTNYTPSNPEGITVDVINTSVLTTLLNQGDTHPVRRLRDDSEYNVNQTTDPEWVPYADVHMAVDTPDDYWALVDAFDSVGESPQDIADWMQQHG